MRCKPSCKQLGGRGETYIRLSGVHGRVCGHSLPSAAVCRDSVKANCSPSTFSCFNFVSFQPSVVTRPICIAKRFVQMKTPRMDGRRGWSLIYCWTLPFNNIYNISPAACTLCKLGLFTRRRQTDRDPLMKLRFTCHIRYF